MTHAFSPSQPTWGSIAGTAVLWILLVLAMAALDLRSAAGRASGHVAQDQTKASCQGPREVRS